MPSVPFFRSRAKGLAEGNAAPINSVTAALEELPVLATQTFPPPSIEIASGLRRVPAVYPVAGEIGTPLLENLETLLLPLLTTQIVSPPSITSA